MSIFAFGTRGGLAPRYEAVANHPARSGSRFEATRSHASSIDSAVTDLDYVAFYDNGRAAAIGEYGALPVKVFVHGYNGSIFDITTGPVYRATDAGFYVIVVNMRGRSGSNGTADDSARELVDIDDAIAHAAATDPTLVDTTRIHMLGYSGGGANAIAYAAKRPGKCVTIVALFGWGDYGVDPSADHSFWGRNPGDRATIEARIGPRSDLGPYHARNSLTNLAQSISLGTTKLFVLWDIDDPTTGIINRDVEAALVAGGAPRSRWYAEESGPSSAIRWEHGYVGTYPQLVNAEYIIHQRRDEPAPTCANSGEIPVNGHMRHPDFDVWTAPPATANPRTSATGGLKFRVDLTFNSVSQQYDVDPLDGDCAVLIRSADGSAEVVHEVTGPTHFDLAGA